MLFCFSSLCLSLQKVYRSDLNYLRGAAWIATGALQIEGSKKATDLISDVMFLLVPYHAFTTLSAVDAWREKNPRCFAENEAVMLHVTINVVLYTSLIVGDVLFLLQQKKYRQQPYNFKHTSVADSPDIVHAKLSGQITNEVRQYIRL